MVNLTAEKRVRAIFYWAHVLGTNAEVITPAMRTPALVAVSTLQLILIASRGHRPYSQKEMDIIYVQVGHQFFTNLETLAAFVDRERMATGARAHARNPTTTRPPIPFKRMRRYTCYNHSLSSVSLSIIHLHSTKQNTLCVQNCFAGTCPTRIHQLRSVRSIVGVSGNSNIPAKYCLMRCYI